LCFSDRRQAAPRFVIKPHSTSVYEGQSAKFTCRVIAVATPTLSWLHNNEELKQSVKYMKRYAGDDYTFIINRCKRSQRGEYVIRAENHYGSREEVVFLNVLRKYSTAPFNCFLFNFPCAYLGQILPNVAFLTYLS